MNQTNLKAAPVTVLLLTVGQALKSQVKSQGSVSSFSESSGIPRSSLYRLFKGEQVGLDILLLTLQALGRTDILEALVAPPRVSPMDRLTSKPGKKAFKSHKPQPMGVQGLAKPRKPGSERAR